MKGVVVDTPRTKQWIDNTSNTLRAIAKALAKAAAPMAMMKPKASTDPIPGQSQTVDSLQEQRLDSSDSKTPAHSAQVAINSSDSETSESVMSVGQSEPGDFGKTAMPASEWTEVGTEFITENAQKVMLRMDNLEYEWLL